MNHFADRSGISRRSFLASTASAAGALGLGGLSAPNLFAAEASHSLQGRIYKSLKIGMVNVPGSLTEKFRAVKEAGFDGIEMDSPGMKVDETKKAIADSGLPVDGTVCSTHWNIRHTNKDPEVRAQALKDLQTAIRDTHAVEGHTVLLVVGHGNDGPENEIWPRALENIRKAIPLAAWYGVYIAIENVWNHFLYQHDGPDNQSADKFVKFVDELNSPWVGMQFDIGNHQKYGKPAEWIRSLGKRIVKLDVKDWGKNGGFVPIGKGDVDWAAVRQALAGIDYVGWGAAEVSGGGKEQLATISRQMDEVFLLK